MDHIHNNSLNNAQYPWSTAAQYPWSVVCIICEYGPLTFAAKFDLLLLQSFVS